MIAPVVGLDCCSGTAVTAMNYRLRSEHKKADIRSCGPLIIVLWL